MKMVEDQRGGWQVFLDGCDVTASTANAIYADELYPKHTSDTATILVEKTPLRTTRHSSLPTYPRRRNHPTPFLDTMLLRTC